jgi:hypothetical protein
MRIEHLQSAAAGVDLVVMCEIGETFEHSEQFFVPGASPNFLVACAALRTERPEPRQLVAALRGRRHGETAKRAYEVERLTLAGLSRILAKPDVDSLAVLRRGIEQQFLHIARVGATAHHIQ